MTLLTDEERAKLVELEKAATPGPWERQPMSEEEPGSSFIVGSNLQGLVGGAHAWPTELDSGDFSRVEANAALIAAARNALPALLAADAAVRGMREALERIARQTLPEDMSVDQQLDADFEGACGLMIECARAALSKAGV